MKHQISRRHFLQMAGMTAGATWLAACAVPAAPPAHRPLKAERQPPAKP